MASKSAEYVFSCDKCPRSFKLKEFYEKHKKVHELKKQHACDVCGYVYGAAKGLEGHLKTHSAEELAAVALKQMMMSAARPVIAPPVAAVVQHPAAQLQPHIVAAPPAAMAPSMAHLLHAPHINFHFLNPQGVLAAAAAQQHPLIPAPAVLPASVSPPAAPEIAPTGTGNYKIYDSVPAITDPGIAVQNDHGLFSCRLCQREFANLNSLRKHFPIHARRVQHACDVCGFVYGKRDYLMDHQRKHTGGSNPACDVCGQSFVKSNKLREHLKTHQNIHPDGSVNPVLPFRCHLCKDVFQQSVILSAHLRGAHGIGAGSSPGGASPPAAVAPDPQNLSGAKCVWCPVCNQGFTRSYNLKVHMAKAHPGHNEVIKLPTSPDPAALESHNLKRRRPGPASRTNAPVQNRVIVMRVATETRDYDCNDCGQNFNDQEKFASHLSAVHGGGELDAKWKGGNNINNNNNNNNSSVVEMIMEESSKLSPKKNGKSGSEAAATMCSVCQQVFPNPSSLRNHVVNVHIQGQSHTCDLCGKAYLSQENLDSHIKSKHPNLNKRLQSLRDAMGLEPEAKRAKLSASPPTQSFSTSSIQTATIVSHNNNNNNNNTATAVNNNNEGEGQTGSMRKKNSVCKVCGVVLSPKTNVNVHMRTHSGARPYQCVLCLNKFRQKAHLMKHFRCSHNQKKPPFICLFCPDECASSNDLYRHITDKHKAETDELIKVNGIKAQDEENDVEQELEDEEEQHQEQPKNGEAAATVSAANEGKRRLQEAVSQPPSNNNNNNNTLLVEQPPQVTPFNLGLQIKLPTEPLQPQQLHDLNNRDDDVDVGRFNNVNNNASSKSRRNSGAVDEVRYEPIMEPFGFEGQIIHPCYIILPFVNDAEIEAKCNRSIRDYYGKNEIEDGDDNGRLTIDESVDPNNNNNDNNNFNNKDEPQNLSTKTKDHQAKNLALEKLVERVAKEKGMSLNNNDIKHETNNNNVYNAEDIKVEKPRPDFYPSIGNYSIPFSLSSIWKKKMEVVTPETFRQIQLAQKEMEAFEQYEEEDSDDEYEEEEEDEEVQEKEVVKAKAKSRKTNNNNKADNHQTAPSSGKVSEYEGQVKNDQWPVECIKCDAVLANLDTFNQHMNDHWSEDKCCPVCGLLINSKRFNFKQHLKIHTGEKPFSCPTCSRSFRQKAHMMKHVTTHRTSLPIPVIVK